MNRYSQSSMEFLVFSGLAFLVVIVIVTFSVNEVKELRDKKEFFLIRDLGLKLQKEVSIAASVEDGYERNFNIPAKLEGVFGYSITMTNATITINSSKTFFSARIINVIGNFTNGNNKIEKINGKIYINND